jgi:hypothetical protein
MVIVCFVFFLGVFGLLLLNYLGYKYMKFSK